MEDLVLPLILLHVEGKTGKRAKPEIKLIGDPGLKPGTFTVVGNSPTGMPSAGNVPIDLPKVITPGALPEYTLIHPKGHHKHKVGEAHKDENGNTAKDKKDMRDTHVTPHEIDEKIKIPDVMNCPDYFNPTLTVCTDEKDWKEMDERMEPHPLPAIKIGKIADKDKSKVGKHNAVTAPLLSTEGDHPRGVAGSIPYTDEAESTYVVDQKRPPRRERTPH